MQSRRIFKLMHRAPLLWFRVVIAKFIKKTIWRWVQPLSPTLSLMQSSRSGKSTNINWATINSISATYNSRSSVFVWCFEYKIWILGSRRKKLTRRRKNFNVADIIRRLNNRNCVTRWKTLIGSLWASPRNKWNIHQTFTSRCSCSKNVR